MRKKLNRLLLSERSDSSYISSFIYILAAVILIAFIINVFHIISTKQEMNHIADQLVKQIQLNGGTSGDTDTLFSFLSSQISDVDGLTYQDALRAGFINGMEERIRLSSEDYTVENISLQFNQYFDKIKYEVTCDATFRIQMFGKLFPPITQHITLTGSHNTRY